MASTIRYSQGGHRFIIDGEMAPGNTITVTVKPLDGYKFTSWADGDTNNPRSIHISECGVYYIANFEASDDCGAHKLYDSLLDGFLCGDYGEYEEEYIECDELIDKFQEIVGCRNEDTPVGPTDPEPEQPKYSDFTFIYDEENSRIVDETGEEYTLEHLEEFNEFSITFDDSYSSTYTVSVEINGIVVDNTGIYTDEEDDIDVTIRRNVLKHTITYIFTKNNK